MKTFIIDAKEINTWDNFHDVFYSVFEFPSYYGRNMDAWIDCMTDLDDTVFTYIKNVSEIIDGDIYNSLIECSAFANYRFIESGKPVIAFAFWENDQYVQ